MTVDEIKAAIPTLSRTERAALTQSLHEFAEEETNLAERAAPQPDFLARAQAIWGRNPPGKLMSEIVAEARGGAA